MTRTCLVCGREFAPVSTLQKYCTRTDGNGRTCATAAKLASETRRQRLYYLRHAAVGAFAVVGGMLDMSSPNVSAAVAAWEYSTVYSQPHPCGASERG